MSVEVCLKRSLFSPEKRSYFQSCEIFKTGSERGEK